MEVLLVSPPWSSCGGNQGNKNDKRWLQEPLVPDLMPRCLRSILKPPPLLRRSFHPGPTTESPFVTFPVFSKPWWKKCGVLNLVYCCFCVFFPVITLLWDCLLYWNKYISDLSLILILVPIISNTFVPVLLTIFSEIDGGKSGKIHQELHWKSHNFLSVKALQATAYKRITLFISK